jgi:hypothetical protein
MRKLALWAVRPKRNASKRHPGHQVYPYLLRGKTIDYGVNRRNLPGDTITDQLLRAIGSGAWLDMQKLIPFFAQPVEFSRRYVKLLPTGFFTEWQSMEAVGYDTFTAVDG